MTGEVRILDAGTAREVWSLRGHTLNVTDADFSPDGRRLVTASADRTVRIWDLGTGKEILKLSGEPIVTTVRFVIGRPPTDRRLDGPDDPCLGRDAATLRASCPDRSPPARAVGWPT